MSSITWPFRPSYARSHNNPVTETWTKRDTATGRFLDSKQDGDPFKGVRKED
ncbi:hypothetical protein [Chamaesiphon minutus]|uniref:hypothetical protein n=1 Tax=Chamaesiphon minutus TaxID=1173032 RepID=UPI0018DED6EB|nr:hypothetical protein [Chamaesiphon minutus]